MVLVRFLTRHRRLFLLAVAFTALVFGRIDSHGGPYHTADWIAVVVMGASFLAAVA